MKLSKNDSIMQKIYIKVRKVIASPVRQTPESMP